MWFTIKKSQIIISIFVKPNAKQTAFIGIKENALQIALHAKPQDGEANKALIAFLAKQFKLPKTQILVARGQQSRHKQIQFPLTDKILELLVQFKKMLDKSE